MDTDPRGHRSDHVRRVEGLPTRRIRGSDAGRSPGLGRELRGVGDHERRSTVLERGAGRRSTAHEVDELLQLGDGRRGVTFEEGRDIERTGLRGRGRRALTSPANSLRTWSAPADPNRFQTLVIADMLFREFATVATASVSLRSTTVAVSKSVLPRPSIEELGKHRLDLDDVAQEEPGHVEIVNGQVSEDAARGGDVVRGRGRVATDDQQMLDLADLTCLDPRPSLGEGGIETLVEAQRNRYGAAATSTQIASSLEMSSLIGFSQSTGRPASTWAPIRWTCVGGADATSAWSISSDERILSASCTETAPNLVARLSAADRN